MKGYTVPDEEQNKFVQYITEMVDVMDDFIEDAERSGYSLDYSLESLDALEEMWLSRCAAEADPERLYQRCVRYYGEVFRMHIGGHWSLHVEPGDAYHLFPRIDDYAPRCLPFFPHENFGTFKVRTWRGHLRKMLEYYRKVRLRPNAR